MQDNRKMRHVVVMSLGSLLLKDDGVGIHAVRKLQQNISFAPDVDVEIIDGGMAPDISVFLEGGIDKLIIIDAIQAHGKPGAIYRLTPDVFESEGQDIHSPHNFNLRESLGLMRLGGVLPSEVVIIGVEPGSMEWGTTLTPEVLSSFPELISIIRREISF
jgi:hydrogenase maturation protease